MILQNNQEQQIFVKMQIDLMKEYRPLLKRIEAMNSYYCYLTGAIIFEFDINKVLNEIYPYWFRKKKSNFIGNDQELSDEEIVKIDCHEMLKGNIKTLDIITNIQNNVQLMIQDYRSNNWLDTKPKKFNEKLEYLRTNKIFNKCYLQTILNLKDVIEDIKQKTYLIYSSYLERKNYLDLLQFSFGSSIFEISDFKKNESKDKLIAIIYNDQILLESVIQLLSLMSDMDKETYLIWINNSKTTSFKS